MTPGRALAVWGGAAALMACLGWGWVLWRGAEIERVGAAADARRGALAGTWLADRPAEAERHAADLADRHRLQEQALAEAEAVLVPPLRPDYLATDLLGAQARLRADVVALRTRAERARIPLPATLPFESGLSPDPGPRALQLGSLAAVRAAVDLLLDAGVVRIDGCAAGRPFRDPAGAYAAFPVELDAGLPADGGQRLLLALRDAHRQGLGVRRVELEAARGAADGGQRIRLVLTLLAPMRPDWRLDPEAAPAPAPTTGLRQGGRP